jgi:hypothetical protein
MQLGCLLGRHRLTTKRMFMPDDACCAAPAALPVAAGVAILPRSFPPTTLPCPFWVQL